MSLNFTQKVANGILNEQGIAISEVTYAYGTKGGFSFTPKQVFAVLTGDTLTIFNLTTFHKVKDNEKINLAEVADLKCKDEYVTFKENNKKVSYQFSKRVSDLSASQKEFLASVEKVAE